MKILLSDIETYSEKFNVEVEQRIREAGQIVTFRKGDKVYTQGEHPKGLYYIEEGLVSLVKLSSNGHESLLRVFGQSYFFGHRSLYAKEPYHGSALVLQPSKILFIPVNNPHDFLERFPDLCCHFLKTLSRELRQAEERFNDATGKRVYVRVVESLIYLKLQHPDYDWTRREIGEFCGAQTETVTRVISDLQDKNLVKKDGRHIDVLDQDKLLEFARNYEA